MTYRLRRQAITGKLVCQHRHGAGWIDLTGAPGGEWEMAPLGLIERHSELIFADGEKATRIAELEARVASYERRAKAQRDSIARRKAAQPKEPTA